MELLHPLQARQNRRQTAIEEHIRDATSVATVEVLTKIEDGETQPYRVDIPREPEGITTATYIERVQEGVTTLLGATSLGETLEYDSYISEHANAKALLRRQQSVFTRHYHPGLRLIFRESQSTK